MAVIAVAAAAAIALTACGSSPGTLSSGVSPGGAASSPAHTLSETGSSLMAPLFALWAPAYHARFSFTRWCGGAA